ncbi:hypothetical protein [Sulfitobacter sp.]|uniref:hypothetical protein n=1 Tax=Sulfitobacter sp. TaxID=1903071 RepID=UPI003001B657
MITTLNLLQKAIGLLTQHPVKTVTVIAPALILMAVVGFTAAIVAPGFLTSGPQDTGLAGPSLVVLAAFVLSYAMMAILWHRYTLHDMGEQQPMTFKLVIGYMWRVLALTAIQISVNFALIIPLILYIRSSDTNDAAPALASILLSTFVTQLVLLWLSLRLSLILPAAALGKPISMVESWRYTDNVSRTLWGVAAAIALANTLVTSFIALIDLDSASYRLVIEMTAYIIQGLLIFSVLTTLYSLQTRKAA